MLLEVLSSQSVYSKYQPFLIMTDDSSAETGVVKLFGQMQHSCFAHSIFYNDEGPEHLKAQMKFNMEIVPLF